ncbi:MAG: glycosyltransferase family 2 protein [Candidatus Omnitrophica bacterium]|nr:glycosyltransferase family 2 protein [Candidatus Omnitrophota bacterium]
MEKPSNTIVSTIIVTCGKANYLKKCLDSCRGQSFKNLELIVIDNSDHGALSSEIQKQYPALKLFKSPQPLSYCQSLNQGIALSEGDYIFALNDDVTLEKDYIEQALSVFKLDEKIGMVSGKILRSDAKTIDTTGLFLSYFRTAKERGYGKKDQGQYDLPGYIFGVNGAVLFYRKKMLEEIKEPQGYFDPVFHVFYEDLDVAWRAQRAGWKAYYIPQAVAYHVRGGSFRLESKGIDKPFARRYLSQERHLDLIKNRYLAMIKNETLLGFLLHLPGLILFECLQWGYCILRRPRLIKLFCQKTGYLLEAFQKRKPSFKR